MRTRRNDDDRGSLAAGLADAGVKALASLVSVAMLLALATVTGGAIVWLRFWSAEFPAERVLVVTPKPDLVVIGASALAAFALAGVAAVLLAYLLDKCGRLTGEAIVALTALAAIGMLVAVAYSGGSFWPRRVLTGVVVLAVAAGALGLYLLFIRGRADGKRRRFGIAAIAAVVLVAAAGLAFGIRWWVGVALVVAAALVAVDLWVARATGTNFRWYGAAIFISVAVFGAVLAAARTYAEPQFQAAALLRESDPGGGLGAIYVTETDDRVYLGQVETACVNGRPDDRPKAGSGRLFWVPRDDVTALAVGRPKRLGAAIDDTPTLLDELEPLRGATLPPRASPPPTSAPTPAPAAPPEPGTTTTPAGAATATPAGPEEPSPGQTRRLLGFVASACDKPVTPPFHGTLLTGSEAFERAMQFRPWLRFDKRERWRPISVDALVREEYEQVQERHRACIGVSELQAACRDVSEVDHLLEAASGAAATPESRAYLDISGLEVDDYCAPGRCGREPLDCDACPSSAIYYRVHRANDRFYIDYWWYFRFNRVEATDKATTGCLALHKRNYPRCFDHEGDWEGMTVITTVDEPYQVEFASFAEHDRIERYPRDRLELRGERTVVYVARGTHAAYPHPCPATSAPRASCAQTTRIFGQPLPEARHDGLGEWGRNSKTACEATPRCLLPFPSEAADDEAAAWDRWEGSWGNCHRVRRRCVLGSGPESPSNQRRYQNPSCFGTKKDVVCDPVVGGTPAASATSARGRVSRARS